MRFGPGRNWFWARSGGGLTGDKSEAGRREWKGYSGTGKVSLR